MNNMVSTVIEVMFYNKNTQIGINYVLHYFIDNSGQFQVTLEN